MAHGATAGALTGNVAGTVTPLNSFIGGHAPNGSNNVKAGLCYLLFDEQFQWVSGGYDPVNGTATGGDKTHLLPNVSVPKNGYIYIYCSNESNINVYFDNIEVSHDRGPLLEETVYYPFGLVMKGISSRSSSFGNPANKKKFNGYEENKSFDLNWLESFYRTYDPQLGRFWQVDPKAIDELSPYAAMMNNPMLMTDALGDTTTYYDTDGNVLYTTKVKGYTRAFIVDNDYIDAAKSIFGNLGTLDLEQQLALDGVILALNPLMKFGDAYDLNSISQFYEENYNKYPIDKIDNVEINEKSMKNLTIDGKRASTASLKGLKCAEASFRMRLVNGIWTVDKNSIKSDNDSTGSDMGDRSVPNGHLHPNHMAINNKLIEFNFGKNKKYSQTLNPNLAPSGGNGWGRADIEIAKEQGRVSNGTMRNVLVNYSHIYLYTGSGYGIQIKRR